jgi:hypothetical protein
VLVIGAVCGVFIGAVFAQFAPAVVFGLAVTVVVVVLFGVVPFCVAVFGVVPLCVVVFGIAVFGVVPFCVVVLVVVPLGIVVVAGGQFMVLVLVVFGVVVVGCVVVGCVVVVVGCVDVLGLGVVCAKAGRAILTTSPPMEAKPRMARELMRLSPRKAIMKGLAPHTQSVREI